MKRWKGRKKKERREGGRERVRVNKKKKKL